jgi:hypothetical protein
MMGIKERIFSPLPRDVSLEELVPEVNFYRPLEERFDLSFVRELVEDNANPSFAKPYAFTDTEGRCGALFCCPKMSDYPDGGCRSSR